MINHRLCLVIFAVVTFAFAGCTSKQPPVATDPVLLTADEIGGQPGPLDDFDVRGAAAHCGPDLNTPFGFSEDEYRENVVKYEVDGKSVIIGVTPLTYRESNHLDDPFGQMRERLEVRCPEMKTSSEHESWEMSAIQGLAYDAFAFQSVDWRSAWNVPIPDSPTGPGAGSVLSTVRAYAVVGDRVLMVRINSDSPTPPPEEELRELWDKQIEKMEQHA